MTRFGYKYSEETKRKISEGVRRAMTPDVRKKIGDVHRGEKNHNFGKVN